MSIIIIQKKIKNDKNVNKINLFKNLDYILIINTFIFLEKKHFLIIKNPQILIKK